MAHISLFVKVAVNKKGAVHEMMIKLSSMLKHEGINTAEIYLKNIPLKSAKQKEEYSKLKTYINKNKSKMKYPEYIQKNLLIGSESIESVHRTVLQKRMKQSGQRWSKEGLHNMIKLRTAGMSGYWNEIQLLIRQAA